MYSLIYFAGVMKAGTEAFSKFLMLHPMIVMQRDMPSTLFFTTNFGKDLQWYRQQVSDASMKTTSIYIYMCLLTCEKCGQKAGGCGRCVSRISRKQSRIHINGIIINNIPHLYSPLFKPTFVQRDFTCILPRTLGYT